MKASQAKKKKHQDNLKERKKNLLSFMVKILEWNTFQLIKRHEFFQEKKIVNFYSVNHICFGTFANGMSINEEKNLII